jgi:hypothetical protein
VAIGLGFQRETSGASRSLYGDGIPGVGVTIEPDSVRFLRSSTIFKRIKGRREGLVLSLQLGDDMWDPSSGKKKGKDGSRWAASAGRFAARVRQMGCTFPLHLLNLQIKSNKFVRIRIVI